MPNYKSPTGSPIVGVLESCPCQAFIEDISEDGRTVTYGTTGSVMDWDSQQPIIRDGSLVFIDENGAEWPFDQLVKQEGVEST